jgi:phasin family protein
MFPVQEPLSTAMRDNCEAQFAMMFSFSGKTLEMLEKLTMLNLAAAKASVQESSAALLHLMESRSPREFLALSVEQTQPNAEKTIAYSRHVAHIASEAQAECIRAAELQLDETRRSMTQWMDECAKSMPAGAKSGVGILHSMMRTASVGYEQVARATRQAVTLAGSTLDGASTNPAPASSVIVVTK